MDTKNYPNLNTDEKNWLVEAAALRPDANVDALIDSFLVLFPDRREHDDRTTAEIRETFKSRFNDILYRLSRGYSENIDQKKKEYETIFTAVFAVLNPLAQMNFYEQMFTNPKSKPSDKFKAINDAEKLKARLFPPPTPQEQREEQRERDRQQRHIKDEATRKRDGLSWRVSRKRFHAVYNALPEPLQKEIDDCPDGYSEYEQMRDVLERENMTAERAAMETDLPYDWAAFLSDVAILEIDEQLSNGGIDERTPDAVDALIASYLQPQRKAAIDALKHT